MNGGSQQGATLYDVRIRQSLSVAVQREHTAHILGTLRSVVDDS